MDIDIKLLCTARKSMEVLRWKETHRKNEAEKGRRGREKQQ